MIALVSLRRGCAALAALLLPFFTTSDGRAREQTPLSGEITVSAAASLRDALEEIGKLYRAARPGITVAFNFGASGALANQIAQGAPVDVFLSAAADQMNRLEQQNLLASATRRNLLGNSLVLIAPAGSDSPKGFADLADSRIRVFAMGQPESVPVGNYTRQVLTHLGLYDRVRAKSVLARDARQVLTYVETKNADAGVVYSTDARLSQKIRVVAEAPPGSHAPILYPAAAIKHSKNPAAATDFLSFLSTPPAREVFARFGFSLPSF